MKYSSSKHCLSFHLLVKIKIVLGNNFGALLKCVIEMSYEDEI